VPQQPSTAGRRAARAAAIVALVVSFLFPAAAIADGVLVIGDSLDVGAGPYIRGELPGVPVTVDARVGRPSSEGLAVLGQRLSPSYNVVVFDLGTNDSPSATAQLAANLQAARKLAGPGRCFVTSTLWRPPYAGVSIDRQNRVIQGFVERYPDVRVADWRSVARYYPNLFAPDHIHASTVGYHLRAGLIARAVEGCPPTHSTSTYTPTSPQPRPERQQQPKSGLSRLGLVAPVASVSAASWRLAGDAAAAIADRIAALP
jgi:hypothetical protein